MKATRSAFDSRSRARAFGTAFVAVAVVLMMVVPAFGATTVNLHGPHVGASSLTFNNEADDGGLAADVVWHFVLNGLDRGTPAAELTVTFAEAGTQVVTARVVGQGQTQHFYVGTPGHDVLLGAFAVVESEGTGLLVLSHVSYDVVDEPPVDEPPVDEPPVDEPPVDEPPVDEPPVDEPPVDEPPVDEPPVDEPPVDEPPVDEPPVDEPPVEDDPFLPFTEEPENDPDPYLPYTGLDPTGLLTAAALVAGGSGLRLAARRRGR